LSTDRTTYYKAAATDLAAPYRKGHGQLYLPGTEHTPDWFDPDAAKSCTHGLYYCSHRRVAARWGPVVLRVQVLGSKLKTNEKVRPGAQPDGIAAQKYRKYRTDRMRILGIVGVTGYAGDYRSRYLVRDLDSPLDATAQSRNQALENVGRLNRALQDNGLEPVFFTGQSLETLRDDRFQLWGVNDPNMHQPLDRSAARLNYRHKGEARRLWAFLDEILGDGP
jgi:hypothetical protein